MVGMSDLQAVFWDMDGTLVDTEPYWIDAEYELVQAHGGTWSEEKAHQLVGQALTYSAGILQEAGVDLTKEQIITHLSAQVAARCAEAPPWRPGALELLTELKFAGIRCALVTMSWKLLADPIMAALPEGTFEFAVTGDMVSAGKPDPEAYELAFEKMAGDHTERTGEALVKDRSIAIEDSVPGTAAAAASGLVTLAVPHYSTLPASQQWHQWKTLDGATVADLQTLLKTSAAAAV
ncbi:HAD family hydrolase [Nesterenkonia sp. MY13]|uniref:HAD family hydrolase n=2 Tax=Nesterenkonia sedimenti TaxID=1463632 RepID=A0A7X8TH80_9MICC|nr:HAD family hydrolase [Nesterenkonia sedimenti]